MCSFCVLCIFWCIFGQMLHILVQILHQNEARDDDNDEFLLASESDTLYCIIKPCTSNSIYPCCLLICSILLVVFL